MNTERESRLFQFGSGGWAVAAAVALSLFVMAWQAVTLIPTLGSHAVGDGKHVESYGFDLSICTIPKDEIAASGMPRDGLPVLDHPVFITPGEADAINKEERGKYLVSTDRVIGVAIGGEAKAYPVRALNWHEAALDEMGGTPILVTYNPLCDSAVVYSRDGDGQTLDFGLSGLLYNSNALLYDKPKNGESASLWIQVLGKAVTGPAAKKGLELSVIPSSLVGWKTWRAMHPDTEVLFPEPAMRKRYKRHYGNYFGSDLLRFPVNPALPENGLPNKTPVIVVGANGQREVYTYAYITRHADASGLWETEIAGCPIRFQHIDAPLTVTAEAVDLQTVLEVRYAFWFVWHAMYPDTELHQ